MFKLLAIRPLEGCAPYIQKCLKTGLMYYFCNDYIIEPGSHIRRRSKNIKPLKEDFFSVPITINDVEDNSSMGNSPTISVSAIVGKNGDGKSTLVELMMRLINNCAITYNLCASSDDLRRVKDVKVELYYMVGNIVYRMAEEEKQNETRIWKEAELNMGFDDKGSEVMRWNLEPELVNSVDEDPKCFFFTIVSNYSHYAYNIYDFKNEWEVRGGEKDDDEKCWLNYIFHKSDGYLTPITLHPFRKKGNIDINNEKWLSKQRLLSLFLNADNPSDNPLSFRRVNGKDANALKLMEETISRLQQEAIIDYFHSSNNENKYVWLVEKIDDLIGRINRVTLSFDDDNSLIEDYKELVGFNISSYFESPIHDIIHQDGFNSFVGKVVDWLKPNKKGKKDYGDIWSVVTKHADLIKKAKVVFNAMICNNNGGKYYSDSKKEKALEEFDLAIELVPNYVEAYINRGGLRYSMGDKDGAMQDYNKAIELNPNIYEIYNNRGNLRADLDDKEGAEQDFDKAIELHPDRYEAYFNRGLLKDEYGDNEGAMLDYYKVIELNSDCYEAYNNIGILKKALDEVEGAMQDFSKAIELNPDCDEAYFNRGLLKDENGDNEGAMLDYDKAIELNPTFCEAYNSRGNLKKELFDKEGAMHDYNKAIELNQDYYEAYYNRGCFNDELGYSDKALLDYNRVIELNSDYFEAYNNRGTLYELRGDYEKAIKDFSKAIQLDSTYAMAYNNRGVAYEKMGNYDYAIIDYSEAIRISPNYVKAYYNRGTAYELKADRYKNRKDYDRAIKDYSKAIDLDPLHSWDFYFARSIVKLKKGNDGGAVKDRNDAIKLNPKYAETNLSIREEHIELKTEKDVHKLEIFIQSSIMKYVYYNKNKLYELISKKGDKNKLFDSSITQDFNIVKEINSTQLGRLDTLFRIMKSYNIDPEIVTTNYPRASLEEKCQHYIVYKVWSILSDNSRNRYERIQRNDNVWSLREYGMVLEERLENIINEGQSSAVRELKQVENFMREGLHEGGLYKRLSKNDDEKGSILVNIDRLKDYYGDKLFSVDILPPPIYKWDLLFNKKNESNCVIDMDSFSSGEKQMLNSMGAIIYHLKNLNNTSEEVLYSNVNLILEEIELYYHPEYQRLFFSRLLGLIKGAKLDNIQNVNIIFVTHSPFILSDIPKCNVLFLKDGMPDDELQENTFGANIHSLLKHGFFMPNLPIGEFAYGKINALFKKLNSGDFNKKEELDDIYQEILLVGEPFLRNQLLLLYNAFKGSK